MDKKIEITAEEFFRKKIRELNPIQSVITMSTEIITAEQGLRWAKEFSDARIAASGYLVEELVEVLSEVKEWASEFGMKQELYSKVKNVLTKAKTV